MHHNHLRNRQSRQTNNNLQISRVNLPDEVTLRLRGSFTFFNHQLFHSNYLNSVTQPNITKLNIDLDEIADMDTAALGLLISARRIAEGRNVALRLINCRGKIRQLLIEAKFENDFVLL